jgi:hypothetical protein
MTSPAQRWVRDGIAMNEFGACVNKSIYECWTSSAPLGDDSVSPAERQKRELEARRCYGL